MRLLPVVMGPESSEGFANQSKNAKKGVVIATTDTTLFGLVSLNAWYSA